MNTKPPLQVPNFIGSGVLVLVLAYTALGSVLFVTLEGDGEDGDIIETSVAASKPYPRHDLVSAEMRLNGISPRTQWGRVAALIYALFGIPIILLYLSAIGEGLSSGMRCIFRRLRPNRSSPGSTNNSNSSNSSIGSVSVPMSSKATVAEMHKRSQQPSYHQTWNHGGTTIHDPCAYALNAHGLRGGMSANTKLHTQSVVPISVCIMILICYITLGAVLFHKLQPWGVLESLYFCFTSLGTIGFGDLMPKGTVAQYAASAYIIIGMAVVAMCFSLIQTELIIWLKKFTIPESLPTSTEDVALVSVAMTPIKS
uniref:Potassium channel domain-containing protein n=1 Tax=Anopheles culicifacies TaxID=139723 RepID=A0A182MFK0_9DIPT